MKVLKRAAQSCVLKLEKEIKGKFSKEVKMLLGITFLEGVKYGVLCKRNTRKK